MASRATLLRGISWRSPTAEVSEGGVPGEKEQVRPQALIALQTDEVFDQRLGDPPRVPAGTGTAGMEVGEVQPGQRSHKKSLFHGSPPDLASLAAVNEQHQRPGD